MLTSDLVTLRAADDRETAAETLRRYGLIAIPVLDDEGRLVGIVTHDDIVEVISQEATEDLQKQGAVGPFRGSYLETGFLTIWRKRSLWLCLLFVAELMTFTVMAGFEEALAAVLVLSLFVPLCISTGGNSGSQAATIITRELALGHIAVRDWWRVLRHEIAMGAVLGVTLGVIGFFRGAFTSEDLRSAKKELEGPDPGSRPCRRRTADRDAAGTTRSRSGCRWPSASRSNGDPADPAVRCEAGTHGPGRPSGSTPSREHGRPDRNRSAAGSSRLVIALSVAFICLWGTMVGAMLPLGFNEMGWDPALASSPFVATFVDVTGILAYFSIAT